MKRINVQRGRRPPVCKVKVSALFLALGVFCALCEIVTWQYAHETTPTPVSEIERHVLEPVDIPQEPLKNAAEDQLDESSGLKQKKILRWYQYPNPTLDMWPPMKNRLDVIRNVQSLGGKTGVEIGVQKGRMAMRALQIWKNCESYKLVDLWGNEENYHEPGPDSQSTKDRNLGRAKKLLSPWAGITEFFVMRSTDAASHFEDNSFDYIYVDARHDYCAVTEDIEYYWPKVKPGGIMAGHDFVDSQYAMEKLGEIEDWSKCEDGSVHESAVKGAVLDFATKHNNLTVRVTGEPEFPSWVMQKPYSTYDETTV